MQNQIHAALGLQGHALNIGNHLVHAQARILDKRKTKALNPSADWEWIVEELLWYTPKADDYAAEKPFDILNLWLKQRLPDQDSETWAKNPLGVIVIGATYLRRAVTLSSSDPQIAWSYLASASYWAGTARADDYILDMLKESGESALSRQASKGGDARHAIGYGPLIEHACRLARELRPKLRGWNSAPDAARTIAPHVVAFGVEHGHSFRTPDPSKTIEGWLKKMPDASDLFPHKGKRKV